MIDFSGVFKFREYEKGITFSFSISLSVELPSLLKLFITLFITPKVIFKRNSKDEMGKTKKLFYKVLLIQYFELDFNFDRFLIRKLIKL